MFYFQTLLLQKYVLLIWNLVDFASVPPQETSSREYNAIQDISTPPGTTDLVKLGIYCAVSNHLPILNPLLACNMWPKVCGQLFQFVSLPNFGTWLQGIALMRSNAAEIQDFQFVPEVLDGVEASRDQTTRLFVVDFWNRVEKLSERNSLSERKAPS